MADKETGASQTDLDDFPVVPPKEAIAFFKAKGLAKSFSWKEIVTSQHDYFFTIAQDKGIQVILTTHSTVVIDQFKDLPESIFVFDKKDQATQVKNLATDIIVEDKILSEKNNVPALDLSGSLGDHWAAGLIGGVPK